MGEKEEEGKEKRRAAEYAEETQRKL